MRFFTSLLVYLLFSGFAMASDPKPQSFTADPKVQQVAEVYAQDAINFSMNQFGIKLDWTDASIANVESVLSKMHLSYTTTQPRPNEEQVMAIAKGFGSYIGEVYRRNHGGEWGIVDLGGQKFPGMKAKSGTIFWPWGRALNRITQGPEDNITDYYRPLLEKR